MAHGLSNDVIFETVRGLDFSKWPLFGPKIYIFAHNIKTIIVRRLILVSWNGSEAVRDFNLSKYPFLTRNIHIAHNLELLKVGG